MERLAAELGGEDGTDPRDFHKKPWDAPKQQGRKAGQLCGQVRDALHAILAGCGDAVLQAVVVTGVEPAPHTGRLLVTVELPADAGIDRAAAENHLRRAAGLLRTEVAATIHRRYAPELTFAVV